MKLVQLLKVDCYSMRQLIDVSYLHKFPFSYTNHSLKVSCESCVFCGASQDDLAHSNNFQHHLKHSKKEEYKNSIKELHTFFEIDKRTNINKQVSKDTLGFTYYQSKVLKTKSQDQTKSKILLFDHLGTKVVLFPKEYYFC